MPRYARNDEKGRDEGKDQEDGQWQEALACFDQADREVEALVHCAKQRV